MYCKHLLITVITCWSLSASAQISKGSLFLGGNLFFSTQKNEDAKFTNTAFSVNPAIGKAIRENLILGIDLTYLNQQTKSNDSTRSTEQYAGAGFFARKYASIGKGFYLFGQARVGGYYYE